jgi:hypothetical protein
MDFLKTPIYLNPNAAPLPYHRNYKQRQKIWDEYLSLKSEYNNNLDEVSDDKFEELFNSTCNEYKTKINDLFFKFKVLAHPTTKNEWFYTFIKSFEIGKEIKLSPNQINIFQKYGENISEYYRNTWCGSCNEYFFELNNKYVKIYKLN